MKILDAIYWLMPKPLLLLLALILVVAWIWGRRQPNETKFLFDILVAIATIFLCFNLWLDYLFTTSTTHTQILLTLSFVEFFTAVAFFLMIIVNLAGFIATKSVSWGEEKFDNATYGRALIENGLLIVVFILLLIWGISRYFAALLNDHSGQN